MEHEQEIENLKKRIAFLEETLVRMWRALGCGAFAVLAVGIAVLPPHLMRWGVIALAVLMLARYWPFVADSIGHQLRRLLVPGTTNTSPGS